MEQSSGKPVRHLLNEAGLNYTISALLPLLVSFLVGMIFSMASGKGYGETDAYKYCAYLVPQLCFAGAALLFFYRNRNEMRPREVYAPCHWKYFLLAVALAAGLFSLSWVNSAFISLLEKLGYRQPASTLPNVGGWYLLPAVLVIALLPAVFEETIFRGIQIRCMRRSGWGTASIILLTGALFALFHGNPQQTIYQFACGVCYALLAVRSGSILPTMGAHFLNNAVILALASAGYEDLPPAVRPYFYAAMGALLLGVLVYLIFFDKSGNRKGKLREGKKYFFAAGVGILACAAEWIATLVQGIV